MVSELREKIGEFSIYGKKDIDRILKVFVDRGDIAYSPGYGRWISSLEELEDFLKATRTPNVIIYGPKLVKDGDMYKVWVHGDQSGRQGDVGHWEEVEVGKGG